MWQAAKAFLQSWGIVILLTVAGLVVAFRFVSPAPPDTVRIASSGMEGSAYAQTAAVYARRLEEEGFEVERVNTLGSVDNLRLLREGRVDFALVQGGVADPDNAAGLVSLGSVFYEPAWVFVRSVEQDRSPVQALRGQAVAVGPEGSGTRVLAFALLAANGLGPNDVEALPIGGDEAAEAMATGRAAGAVIVAADPTQPVLRLMRTEGVELLNFGSRADAYAIQLPYLTPVRLPRSSLSLAEDIPADDVMMMAPTASVLAREDANPQLASLMMLVLRDVHRGRSLFSPEGSFPNERNQSVPLQEDAQRFYERGPTFLQTYLPFWAAVLVERLWVLLIPLIGLLIPLVRIAPAIYTWQIERKLWAIYNKVRKVDMNSHRGLSVQAVAKLEALDEEAARLELPDSYADRVYELRRHITWLKERKIAEPI